MFFEGLVDVGAVLVQNPEKAAVYFILAVVSAILIGSTCLCGHWIALKLAPVTQNPPQRRPPYHHRRHFSQNNLISSYPGRAHPSVIPLPRTFPLDNKQAQFIPISPQPMYFSPMRSRSFVHTPTQTDISFEQLSRSQLRRLGPTVSEPDISFTVGVQTNNSAGVNDDDAMNDAEVSITLPEMDNDDDYGFLYYNNNLSPNSPRRLSWIYVHETLV